MAFMGDFLQVLVQKKTLAQRAERGREGMAV
jgi:hypothetical protein